MARKEKNKRHGSDGKPRKRNTVPLSDPPADEEYKVGPGRPPKEHQFRPGQSGNPKGRKRKKASLIPKLKEEFERVFSQKLKVTQGDEQRFITRWVAGLEQLSIQFAKGDRHARRDVLYFAEKLGVDLLNSTAADATVCADHQAILDAYVERRMQEKALSASSPVIAPPELLDDAPDEADKN
jgi:hypothetical protein